jgi:trans-aconitate methyltransferase
LTDFASIIGQTVKRPADLLDLGCGLCEEGEDLIRRGWALTGIDQDGETIRQVRSRLPDGRFITADAAHWLLRCGDKYDVILIRRPDLAHRPENWLRIFQALGGLLKPGGVVFVTTPGVQEMSLCRRWLREAGGHTETVFLGHREEEYLVKAQGLHEIHNNNEPMDRLISELSWEDDRPHMVCDLRTGRCTAVEESDSADQNKQE